MKRNSYSPELKAEVVLEVWCPPKIGQGSKV